MGIGDFVPDVIEDKVEDATEWVGDRVEDAGDWTADRLEDVGWDSGADWVREQSRSLANRMGAEVDEMDLGQSEDKTKLVYGSPSKLRSTATNLKDLQRSFNKVAMGLKGLDSSALKGQAADAFRSTVAIEPPKWVKGSEAFGKAAGALETFASTVEWAQGQAQLAIDKWKAGTKASEDALNAHKSQVDTYNKAADAYNAKPADQRDPATLPPKPGAFTDPGKARMEEAQQILAEARRQRNTAAETARSAVRAARDTAPPKPSYAQQFQDGMAELEVMQTHLGGGIIKGTADLLSFVRSVNPMDAYNITHPAEYGLALNNMGAGLVQVANDPWGAGKQIVDGFMKDPAEGFGRLAPDALLTAATGGAGAAVKGVRVAGEAADLAVDANRARRGADEAGNGTYDRSDGRRVTTGTDPVDLASGRMFLPQTDASLPGALPLVFTRRVESGYTAGRLFGPSWSSTVDERLEIDARGVVHVTADGLLLTYPHPVPGVPTLPESGAALSPLDRDGTGDYTVTDPATGLVRHFAAPPGADPGEDGDAWLVQVSDRNGHTITVDRTDDGSPLALAHSAGHRLALTVTDGRVSALALAPADGGAVLPLMAYGYTDGDLTEVTGPSGGTLTFEYDDRHRVTAWIDSNRRRYDYAYDDRDRVIAEGGEAGHMTLRLSYGEPDPATGLRTTTTTTGEGHVRRFTVDRDCQIVASTDPLGATTRFERDRRGRLLSRTDPLGHRTGFAYDENGRIVRITGPDGRESRTEFNGLGLPVKETGADGRVRRHTYDERGNRTSVTESTGRTTRFTYDGLGRLTSVTDPLGHRTAVRCDRAGLPVEVTDPLGGITRYERDAYGRPIAVTDPLGATTRLERTAEGRLTRRVFPDGTGESWTYDGEGNCTSHTDPMGLTTRFEYSHFDLMTARTGPDGARHEFRHDAELRLVSVHNPAGLTWSYAYDPAGNPVRETDFDGRTLTYAYDAAGRLGSRTDALGRTTVFERDRAGRVVRKEADGRATTYVYDHSGRLARAENADSVLTLLRDRHGRLRSETVNGRRTSYTYDVLGRRISRTTPSGAVSTWEYDATGNPTRLTASGRTLDFEHDAAGRETVRLIGESLTLTQVFDEVGRTASQHLAGPSGETVSRRAYAYRADGCVTGIEDHLRGTRTFDLDGAGRVTAVHAAGWSERYTYDEAGNQTTAEWPSTHPGHEATGPRTYSGTTITRAGNVRYEHDALGRVTLRRKTRLSRRPDIWRYEWDSEDRLSAVTTPDGTRWQYAYDPLGRRIAKTRMGPDGSTAVERTDFTWDGSTLCEQTTASPDHPRHSVSLTWDHDGLHPLTQTERIHETDGQGAVDERFFAIVSDLVGTPTELVDENGDVAWRTRATLWGSTTWAASSTAYTPLRFPGQYYDPETGLHYNYFRTYDPETARYFSPDPLGLVPAPNPVTYVVNPLTWADPFGLTPDYPPADPLAEEIARHANEEAIRPDGNGTHYVRGVHPEAIRYYVDGVINGDVPNVEVRYDLRNGRVGYWDPDKEVVVIEDGDGGTVFTPRGGKAWFDDVLE
ncbi:putative T7SS-secreted protein [Streptomyces sp. NPDC051018]|uniref:putative T7SS-secreted protein n=1 Tax=Streptomyces sp. NPDC051018 TaxID=3365639 RepID=UPI0037A2D12C